MGRQKLTVTLAIIFTMLGIMFIALRSIFPLIGFLLLAIGAACFIVAGLAILFFPWQNPILRKVSSILKWASLAIFLLTTLSFVIVQSLIWNTVSQARNSEPQAQVLIVLGAGLRDDQPLAPLARRLQSALVYMQDNPNSVAVLSGGQDDRNSISEAMAMRSWLVNRGITSERLFLEEYSTSTAENFAFSMYYLRQLEATQVVIVTNEFHLYRAAHLARHYGLEPELLGSTLPRYEYFLREYFAVLRELSRIYLFPSRLPIVSTLFLFSTDTLENDMANVWYSNFTAINGFSEVPGLSLKRV